MRVLAIDPGNKQSAWLIYENGHIPDRRIEPNETVLTRLESLQPGDEDYLAIEMIQSFGMAVGAEVFETVFWIGRFFQAWKGDPRRRQRLKRSEIKMHLCGSNRAKDGNIRQALIDRFGAPGTKNAQGATYGISKDLWSALAVAVTFTDKHDVDEDVDF